MAGIPQSGRTHDNRINRESIGHLTSKKFLIFWISALPKIFLKVIATLRPVLELSFNHSPIIIERNVMIKDKLCI